MSLWKFEVEELNFESFFDFNVKKILNIFSSMSKVNFLFRYLEIKFI